MSGERFKKRDLLFVLCGVVCTLILLRVIKSVLGARRAADAGVQTQATRPPVTPPTVEEAQQPSSPDRRKTSPKRRRPAKREPAKRPGRLRLFSLEKLLLAVEVGAVLVFVIVGAMLWQTRRELNESYRTLQRSAPQAMPTLIAAANPATLSESLAQANPTSVPAPAMPTPFPTVTPQAVADAVQDQQVAEAQAPAGQQDPVFQQSANGARNTAVGMQKQASVSEREQSQRLQIPAIGVDNFVFQYDGPHSLKLGVVQVGQAVAPGEEGNLVLAAHNDIYGEIFRDLDKLQVGDELFLLGDDRNFTYRVRDTLIVEPDDAWVMQPTSTPTLTLVSCYPYIMDTHRIVVFADLSQ